MKITLLGYLFCYDVDGLKKLTKWDLQILFVCGFFACMILVLDTVMASFFSPLVSIQNTTFFAFAQNENNLTLSNLVNQGAPYYGNTSNSSLVIVDFSDFQCHLCKRHVDNTEPQINSTFIQNGEATYVLKHLPNRGFDSKPAALASQCTNDQGKFWEYHKILYKNQGPIDSGWASAENLRKFATQLQGIDINQFNSCFDGKKYEGFVDNDIALAKLLGFTETPSFIIMNADGSNIKKIAGPKPFPIFETVINDIRHENNSQ
jgi:protein-disulfide isomerase